MDEIYKQNNHKVVAYMWNDSGKLDRKLYEYQTAEQVEHLKSKHHHHDLKVYNYFGQLVHEHKGNAQATETYA